MTDEGPARGRVSTRRRLLRAGAVAGAASVAGCSALPFFGEDSPDGEVTLAEFRGSGPLVEGRPEPEGTRMADLPDLEGSLTVYLGGGEGGLYTELIGLFERVYPDLDVKTSLKPSAQHANTIIEEQEGSGSPADVFWAVDAGSLGTVADAGYTVTLPTDAVDPVPENFRPGDEWVGVAGRARSVPYNTDRLSAADVPETVQRFPEELADRGMGWAPTYGAFQSFVTAMRHLRGDAETRQWLQAMVDRGVSEYHGEFLVSNAVADGEVAAGFANHYYALRVKERRPDAPIELAFTTGDAGALVNVAGAAVVEGTDVEELATDFVRHLLSAEAQEFFATRTFAYPMIPGVQPVGGLPRIDELEPPELSLAELSDVQPTLDLMREVGLL